MLAVKPSIDFSLSSLPFSFFFFLFCVIYLSIYICVCVKDKIDMTPLFSLIQLYALVQYDNVIDGWCSKSFELIKVGFRSLDLLAVIHHHLLLHVVLPILFSSSSLLLLLLSLFLSYIIYIYMYVWSRTTVI